MPDGGYDTDILIWSERQSDLLRRLAAGERVNGVVDWPNVIEEVHDVGLSQLNACASLLRQALVHLLKLHAWPNSRAARHWRSETVGFLADAQQRFAPSMAQRIALPTLFATASKQVNQIEDDSGSPRALPDECPFALADLLSSTLDVHALLVKLGGQG